MSKENRARSMRKWREKTMFTPRGFFTVWAHVMPKRGITRAEFSLWVKAHHAELQACYDRYELTKDEGDLPTIYWNKKWDLSTARVGLRSERGWLIDPASRLIPLSATRHAEVGDPITDPSTGEKSYFFSSEEEVKRWQEVHPGEPVPFPV